MSRHIGRRRLIRFAPAAVLYARSAALERRSIELAAERRSKRLRRIGREISQRVEEIADAETRRPA